MPSLNALLNIIGLIAIIAIAILIFYFAARSQNTDASTPGAKRQRTDAGVDATLRALSRYAASHGFKLLRPAHFCAGQREAELDAVLVTFNGLVGVRCLGYNGEIFANPGEAEWLWVTGEGRERIPDPVAQCAADARALRDVLMQDTKLRSVPVECLPVFTDKSVHLSVPKSLSVLRRTQLIPLLEQQKYLEDRGLDVDRVCALLEAARKN